jgi:ribosomal protein L14
MTDRDRAEQAQRQRWDEQDARELRERFMRIISLAPEVL